MAEATEYSVDQCYFGYTNRGHGLLCASFDHKELLTFLSRVTDLPINKPADIHPGIFYGCHRFEHYLIFTKTFPDLQSVRSGMVFTHAIIIKTTLSESIGDLQQLFTFFINNIPDTKPTTLPRLSLQEQIDQKPSNSPDKQKLIPILNFFLSANPDQAVVIPLDQEMPAFYLHLWNALKPDLRHFLTFRLTFNPVDIEPSAYQLYFTSESLLTRWPPEMQYAAYKETDGQISESVKFLLAMEGAEPFTNFIQALGYQTKDFKGFRFCEMALGYYKQLNDLDKGKLIQLLRLIVLLSPHKTDGESIKTSVIAQLIKHLEQAKEGTFVLLSLANFEPTALENFLATISPKIEHTLNSWWKGEKIDFLEQVINRRIEAPANNWWLTVIDASFTQQISEITDRDLALIYQLWAKAAITIAYLWNLIKPTKSLETLLVNNLPKNLDNKVVEELLPLVKKRGWLQLHASIIVQKWKPEKALAEQLLVTTDDKDSLTIIAKKFKPALFIQIAITHNNPVLQEIAFSLPVEIADIAQIFKVENERWQEFIYVKLSESLGQKKKLNDFESVITLIIDGLVEGKHIGGNLLSLISTTSFANVSNYPNRASVWDKLQGPVKTSFLKSTGSALLEHITTTENIETALKDAMLDLNIAGDYMYAHAKNWPDILRLFELFPLLPEKYLEDHIRYSSFIDNPANGTRLGNLIKRNLWRNCAIHVYDKAKYNESFKTALAKCMDLLDSFKKMKVKYTFSNMSSTWLMSETEWLTSFEAFCIDIYDEENEIHIIWKKAQGSVADLKSKESARAIWHHALQNLNKGKMKDITFRKLLLEMMANVPAKKEHLQMLLTALNDIKSIK